MTGAVNELRISNEAPKSRKKNKTNSRSKNSGGAMLGELTSFFKKGAEELSALKDELKEAASDALKIDEPEEEEEDPFKLPKLKPHDYRLRRLSGESTTPCFIFTRNYDVDSVLSLVYPCSL